MLWLVVVRAQAAQYACTASLAPCSCVVYCFDVWHVPQITACAQSAGCVS